MLLLTACAGSKPPAVKVRAFYPPPAAIACAPQPEAPDDQADGRPEPEAIAQYMLDTYAAGQDCRDAVTSARAWAMGLPGADEHYGQAKKRPPEGGQ